eukprot:777808_1
MINFVKSMKWQKPGIDILLFGLTCQTCYPSPEPDFNRCMFHCALEQQECCYLMTTMPLFGYLISYVMVLVYQFVLFRVIVALIISYIRRHHTSAKDIRHIRCPRAFCPLLLRILRCALKTQPPSIYHQTIFDALDAQHPLSKLLMTPKSDKTAQHNTAYRVDGLFQSTVSTIRFDQTDCNLISTHHTYTPTTRSASYIVEVHPQNHTFRG